MSALLLFALAASRDDFTVEWTRVESELRDGALVVRADAETGAYPPGVVLTVQLYRIRSRAVWPRGDAHEGTPESDGAPAPAAPGRPALEWEQDEIPTRWQNLAVAAGRSSLRVYLPMAAQYQIVTIFSPANNDDPRLRRIMHRDFRDRTHRHDLRTLTPDQLAAAAAQDLARIVQIASAFDTYVAEYEALGHGPQAPMHQEQIPPWLLRARELEERARRMAAEGILTGGAESLAVLIHSFGSLVVTGGVAITSDEQLNQTTSDPPGDELATCRFQLTGEWLPPPRARELTAAMRELAVREALFHAGELLRLTFEKLDPWRKREPPNAAQRRPILDAVEAELRGVRSILDALETEPTAALARAWSTLRQHSLRAILSALENLMSSLRLEATGAQMEAAAAQLEELRSRWEILHERVRTGVDSQPLPSERTTPAPPGARMPPERNP